METYVERMVEEFNQLEERAGKLNLFITTSEAFQKLPEKKRKLMILQLNAMRIYEHALNERLALEDTSN